MLTRILTALLLIPLVLLVVFLASPLIFALVVTLLCALGMHEFSGLMPTVSKQKPLWFLVPLSALCGFLTIYPLIPEHRALGFALFICILGCLAVITCKGVEEVGYRFIWPVAGFGYLYVLFSFVYEIRYGLSKFHGAEWLLLFLLLQWVGDSFAYFSGMIFGRHKLAPRISPKKTIEGTIGGLVGSAVVAGLMPLVVNIDVSPLTLAVIGGLTGGIGQFGDLLESLLKRAAGVKDSSGLIPGHGGILDRMDSLIFSAPVFYLFLSFLSSQGAI